MLGGRLKQAQYARVMTHVEDKIKSALGVTILKDGWMNVRGDSILNLAAATPKSILYNANCVAMNTGVSQDEVKEILRLHNDYRQKAAQGLIRNLPPAADMMELVWDRELATIAQAHSSQCQFKHDCLDCRKVPRFATGQNMFRFKTNDPNPDEASDWVSAIASWEEKEEQFFDPSEVKKLRGRSSKAAHLSQSELSPYVFRARVR
ncbi:hypothetical protein HPB47_024336 [Ixodes persulcatus]|uniref:Uncharacterized protein n=1 Tax=Ixodes persulcatus TaxID=34615 RepID=A0AC60Q4L0_IXOPE|nr:hypothetical protein HPB47_024336 [Ixodes persulcatus]